MNDILYCQIDMGNAGLQKRQLGLKKIDKSKFTITIKMDNENQFCIYFKSWLTKTIYLFFYILYAMVVFIVKLNTE